jgi:hypothetical protein
MLHRRKQVLSRFSGAAFWVCTIFNGLAVVWTKLPTFSGEPSWYTSARELGRGWGDVAIFAFSVGIFVSALVQRIVGRMATWDTLHSFISDLRSVMVDPENENPTTSKATIYRAVKVCPEDGWWDWIWCRFKSGRRWLVPVVRSHHLDQRTKTCFPISDDPAQCIGVAGQAWAQEQILFVSLPDVSGENPYPKVLSSYRTRGFVTMEWIKKHKPTCRTVLAIPLVVAGEHWGVLVFHTKTVNGVQFEDIEPIAHIVQKHVTQLLAKNQ